MLTKRIAVLVHKGKAGSSFVRVRSEANRISVQQMGEVLTTDVSICKQKQQEDYRVIGAAFTQAGIYLGRGVTISLWLGIHLGVNLQALK